MLRRLVELNKSAKNLADKGQLDKAGTRMISTITKKKMIQNAIEVALEKSLAKKTFMLFNLLIINFLIKCYFIASSCCNNLSSRISLLLINIKNGGRNRLIIGTNCSSPTIVAPKSLHLLKDNEILANPRHKNISLNEKIRITLIKGCSDS